MSNMMKNEIVFDIWKLILLYTNFVVFVGVSIEYASWINWCKGKTVRNYQYYNNIST